MEPFNIKINVIMRDEGSDPDTDILRLLEEEEAEQKMLADMDDDIEEDTEHYAANSPWGKEQPK